MTQSEKCSKKKQLFVDLLIILIVTFSVLGILIIFGNQTNEFVFDSSINIVLRVAVI